MKFPFLATTFAACAFCATSGYSATVTSGYIGTRTETPGASTDFTLFGNPSTYPNLGNSGGQGGQPTVLDDLSVTVTNENMWGGSNGYSTITAPDGHSYLTGLIFNSNSGQADPALATVKLGTSSGFNYGDFNLYIMFGNGDANGNNNHAFTVTVGRTTYTASDFTDDQSTNNGNFAQFEEFHIQGLSAGDTFTVGATTNGELGYLGGLSFESAPEPSTYALMLGGLGLLGLVLRKRVRA